MRRKELIFFLVMTGLLIALSITGAFLGVDGISALLGSFYEWLAESLPEGPANAVSAVPMVLWVTFWSLMVLLFVACLLTFPRLRRSPGRLALHIGPLLILAGAMWGSNLGHRVANDLLGTRKAHKGYMLIKEGQASNAIYSDQSFQNVEARLPFSLLLSDFRVERYEPKGERWELVVVAPPELSADHEEQEGHDHQPRQQRFDWTVGNPVVIPFTEAEVTVLNYIDHARRVYPKGQSVALKIAAADGTTTTLPAEVGREAAISDPDVTVRIQRVFLNLKVVGSGETRQITDAGGDPDNPALEVKVTHADGTAETRYAMARWPMHGQTDDGLKLTYDYPEPKGAEPDPSSDTPAMEVLITAGDLEHREWFLPRPSDRYVWTSLESVLGEPDLAATMGGGNSHGVTSPRLYLARPMAGIKDYLSEIAVIDEGQHLLHQTVEVNAPLHYGGYHFYQHSYDRQGERYTILSVSSDSGLLLVYGGFFLLVAGAFWQAWFAPIYHRFAERRPHGD